MQVDGSDAVRESGRRRRRQEKRDEAAAGEVEEASIGSYGQARRGQDQPIDN